MPYNDRMFEPEAPAWRERFARWICPTGWPDVTGYTKQIDELLVRLQSQRATISDLNAALSGRNVAAAQAGGPVEAQILGETRYGETIRHDAINSEGVYFPSIGTRFFPEKDGTVTMQRGDSRYSLTRTTITLP